MIKIKFCCICGKKNEHYAYLCPERCIYCTHYHKTRDHYCSICMKHGVNHIEENCDKKKSNLTRIKYL